MTPSFEIRTPRLVLAPGGAGDQAPIDAMLRDPRVAQPFSLRLASGGGEPRAATGTWLQAPEDWERLRRLTLVIRLDPAGDVIGGVGLAGQELSFFVGGAHWGHGYGGEAVAAACRELPSLLGLPGLEASVLRENVASCRILEKVGFRFQGLHQRPWRDRPGRAPVLIYRLGL